MSADELTPQQWATILDRVEGPTFHQIAVALVDGLDVTEGSAYSLIGDALDDGTLVEGGGPGALPYLRVTEPFVPEGEMGVPSEATTEHYRGLQHAETDSGAFGEAVDQPSWMPTCSGMGGKLPFAKYHDHPALDYYDPDDEEQSHPQYSWSDPTNWLAFEEADRRVRNDVELVGRAFIMQNPNDPDTDPNTNADSGPDRGGSSLSGLGPTNALGSSDCARLTAAKAPLHPPVPHR